MKSLIGSATRRLGTLTSVIVLGGCAPPHPASDELSQIYSEAQPYDAWVAQHEEHGAAWAAQYGGVVVDTALVERVRAVPGSWQLLAVVAPWCPDSQATVSALARLSEEVDNLELRLTQGEDGDRVKDAHRTPDGRSSTPTLLLLDASGTERGCLVEMPAEMLEWWVGEGLDTLAPEATRDRKLDWYRDNGGRAAWTDLVLMMEAAARGEQRCAPDEAS